MTSAEISRVYDALLAMPWMNEPVKLNYQPTRKLVLLLAQVIDLSLREKPTGENLLAFVPEESEELKKFAEEWLEKAGIKPFAEKLKTLHR